jgi:hypothetical protein
MSENGNESPAQAWARSRPVLDWLQERLRAPLAAAVDASGILPPGGLLDVHVVELVALSREMSTLFQVDHACRSYALHVWLWHLMGGQRAGFQAPSTDRRAKESNRIGERCESIFKEHGAALVAKWKALAKAERAGAGVAATREAYRAVVRSTSAAGIGKLLAALPAAAAERAAGGKRRAEPATAVAPKRASHGAVVRPLPLVPRPSDEMEVEDRHVPPLQQQAAALPPPEPPAVSAAQQQPTGSRRLQQPCPTCGEVFATRLLERERAAQLEAEVQSLTRRIELARQQHSESTVALIKSEEQLREKLEAKAEAKRAKLAAQVARLSGEVHAATTLGQKLSASKAETASARRDLRKEENTHAATLAALRKACTSERTQSPCFRTVLGVKIHEWVQLW